MQIFVPWLVGWLVGNDLLLEYFGLYGCSSVSVMSDYILDDRAIGDRSPEEAKDFTSNLCVQTGSEARPAFCTMGTGGPFPGVMRGRIGTLTTHPI
jgi:hypothetical protein